MEISSNLGNAPEDMRARSAEMFDLKATIRPDGSRNGYHVDLSANIPLEMVLMVTTYSGFRQAVYNPDTGLVNEQTSVVLNDCLLTFREISQRNSLMVTLLLFSLYTTGASCEPRIGELET